jgi:hypothetical protein
MLGFGVEWFRFFEVFITKVSGHRELRVLKNQSFVISRNERFIRV